MHDGRFLELLQSEAQSRGLELDDECAGLLEAHYRLLVKWNRAVRLIGKTDPETVVRRHALESLELLAFLHEPKGSLLDIGSGNGYPAIPLKCALPELRLGLIEPTIRKSTFLRTVIGDLGLGDCEVIRERVDRPADLGRHGRWDQITMRAVAAIPAVLDGAPGALRPAGRLLFLVGRDGRDQIHRHVVPPLAVRAEKPLTSSGGSLLVVVEMTGSPESTLVH